MLYVITHFQWAPSSPTPKVTRLQNVWVRDESRMYQHVLGRRVVFVLLPHRHLLHWMMNRHHHHWLYCRRALFLFLAPSSFVTRYVGVVLWPLISEIMKKEEARRKMRQSHRTKPSQLILAPSFSLLVAGCRWVVVSLHCACIDWVAATLPLLFSGDLRETNKQGFIWSVVILFKKEVRLRCRLTFIHSMYTGDAETVEDVDFCCDTRPAVVKQFYLCLGWHRGVAHIFIIYCLVLV